MMMPGFGFGGMGYAPQRRFEEQYHCYSVAYAGKAHLERGDKILLPPSAFDVLARLQVDYPMLFRLNAGSQQTHCGVLEFTAEEGCCYIPFWMMQNLLIEEGGLITVTNVSLPKATLIKLKPQSVDFLEISNPRAVLEHALRNYSCVTIGDVIQIPYNNKNYHFELKAVEPAPAACIIETDCNVEFDAPVGYKEPCHSPAETATTSSAETLDTVEGGDSEPQTGIRVVDGCIIRPDMTPEEESYTLAQRTGGTGVQKNAAIPEVAPEIEYWGSVGSGARLDGKKAPDLGITPKEEEPEPPSKLAQKEGITVAGTSVEAAKPKPAAGKQRKVKKVGSKYSRLKANAFQGSANKFDS